MILSLLRGPELEHFLVSFIPLNYCNLKHKRNKNEKPSRLVRIIKTGQHLKIFFYHRFLFTSSDDFVYIHVTGFFKISSCTHCF